MAQQSPPRDMQAAIWFDLVLACILWGDFTATADLANLPPKALCFPHCFSLLNQRSPLSIKCPDWCFSWLGYQSWSLHQNDLKRVSETLAVQ